MLVDVLWEIGSRPGLGDSLDRVDNGGNHEPATWGWTTPGEARPEQAPLAPEQPGDRVTASRRAWVHSTAAAKPASRLLWQV
jgi:hypothetical protein